MLTMLENDPDGLIKLFKELSNVEEIIRKTKGKVESKLSIDLK